MDDHHGYLEHKFHEETAASNDQHSLTSIQRQSVSVIEPSHYEQMKQFQREQQQLDLQHQHTQQQQDKLNEKFKIYKKLQQKQHYEQQQSDIQQFQMQQEMMENKQKQLEPPSVHGHFGQKMFSDYAKPFYPTEHQHQSILTLQTHLLQDERFKPNKNIVPEFKPIANVRTIPIEQQPLQQTPQLYSVNMDQQMVGAESNVKPVAIEPDNETTDKNAPFRINVSEPEQLPKPEAITMNEPYQYTAPQTGYNAFQVFQFQPVSSFPASSQSLPMNVS